MKISVSDKGKLFITFLFITLLLLQIVCTVCLAFESIRKKDCIEGDCVEGNCENGHGTFIYSDNAKYKGQFKDGKWHGLGAFNLSAIEVGFCGTWRYDDDDDMLGIHKRYKHGLLFHQHFQSEYSYLEGGKPIEYIGEFKNGVFDGHGTITLPSTEKYVGEFKNGLPDGHGTYIFPGGKKYVGKIKKGAPKGQGTMTYPDGREYFGELEHRQLYVQDVDVFDFCCLPNGQGTIIYPDGTKQEGMFVDGEYVNLPSNKTNFTAESKTREIAEKNKRGIIGKLEDLCSKHITSLGYSIDKIKLIDIIDMGDDSSAFCLLYKSGDFIGGCIFAPSFKYVIYSTAEDMKRFNNLTKIPPDKKRHFIRSEFIKYAKYEFPK